MGERKPLYQVGSQVEAKIKGWKKHYKGKVTGFDSATGTYSVEFEDGDKQDGVKEFNIRGPQVAESFTAPDGKVFDSKAAYRKYMSETFFSFKNLSGQSLMKKEGDIQGQTFNMENLDKCEVQIMDHSDQVLVDGITDCKILIGPSSESVFIRRAKNCHLFIACKQFRCRDCENCTVSLYSKTEPVVETSTKMRFYPYSASYANQSEHFKKANLIPDHNHWCNVFDFNKDDKSIPEPHWELVPESEGWTKWELGEGGENPVPPTARATVVPKESGFSIHITQQAAQQAFDQAKETCTSEMPQVSTSAIIPLDVVLAASLQELEGLKKALDSAENKTQVLQNPSDPLLNSIKSLQDSIQAVKVAMESLQIKQS